MDLRNLTRGLIQTAAAAVAVYAAVATLRRMEQRAAHSGLAKGKRFLILGGGFAGAAAAQALARLLPREDNGEIVLIDEDNYLLFTPMLTEAAGGEVQTRYIVQPTRSLGKRIRFVQGQIQSIDLEKRSVEIETGMKGLEPATRTFTGDHLILALGSVVNFHHTPGVAENALTMKRLQDAPRAFVHVSACLERANTETDDTKRKELLTFVVAGGGYTGVETMAAINDLVRDTAEALPGLDPHDVRTILVHPEDRLLPEITPDLAAYATEKLKQRGVEIRLNAKIDGAGANFVEVQGGERIATRTLIWAAGVTPNPLLKDLPAPKGKHHGLAMNGCLEVPGFAGVWALGDCAEIPKPDGKGTYAPTAQMPRAKANTWRATLLAGCAAHR